jgi:NDP-sugar pyrophosphorylase family protein
MSLVHRAVVLAAGRGTRMMPLTANLPKPLIPVAGVPILERILRGLAAAGVDEAVVVTGYLGRMIEEYFGDGARVGMRLHYRTQDPPNGTAGAVLQVEDLCGDEPFVLHWGDILVSPENYPAILNTYHAQPTPPACVEGLNYMADPCSGAAVYRAHGRIVRIVENPAPGTSATTWNNAGVLVLGPQVWPYLHRVTPSPRGELEFTDVLRMLIDHDEFIIGHELAGLWSDVGTPEIVAELNGDARLAAGV